MNPVLVIILRWLTVTIGITIAALIGGIYFTNKVVPKVYTSQTSILLVPPGSAPSPRLAYTEPEPFQPEFEFVQSPVVLTQVIADLDLKKKWSQQVFHTSSDISDDKALRYLQNHLKIDFQSQTAILTIAMVSTDPQEAADIANAIADRYRTHRGAQSLYLQQVAFEKKTGANAAAFLKLTSDAIGKIHEDLEKTDPHDPHYAALQEDYRQQLRQLEELQQIDQSPAPSKPLNGAMKILSPAVPATTSTEPNQSLYLIITLLMSLSLGAILATFLEMGFWFRRIT